MTIQPETNEVSAKANGGTELQMRGLFARVDPELLSNFQIVPSRMRELREDKVRVLYCHDLPEDPEGERALTNGGWARFHKLVFVSNWQMQRFIERYGIPWERCVVLHNAIVPIAEHEKPTGPVRIVYTSTPQRGLDVLNAAYAKLAEEDPEVELHVFSSYKLYGWEDADKPFEPLFEDLRSRPRVTLHGVVPNEELHEQLKTMHVFGYPSTWVETSCICLMEAMSAGLVCVHPNLGALYETAAGTTLMYQWRSEKSAHAGIFYLMLKHGVQIARERQASDLTKIKTQKWYADSFYNWEGRSREWEAFLRSIVDVPREMQQPTGPVFKYKVR